MESAMRLFVVGVLGVGMGSLSLGLLNLVVGTCGMECMKVLRRRRGIREMGGVGLGIFFDLMSVGWLYMCVCVCVSCLLAGTLLWLVGRTGTTV